MARKYLEIVTSPDVLRAQEQYYGRSRPITAPAERDPLGPVEAEFIAARDSFYMATVNAAGWPYMQHRGGPPGFLHVSSASTLAFADYEGNHQMISTGNLVGDDRVALFLMDYPGRRRLKLLGHARVDDARARPDLVEQVAEPARRPHVARVVTIEVVSFDWNCPKYITPRFTAAEVAANVEPLQREIAALHARLDGAEARREREKETEHA